MPIVQKRVCREYVFTNDSFIKILEDMQNYFKERNFDINVEECLEDCIITYDQKALQYVASVYVVDESW